MANYERGAYDQSDEVRVYDGADDEDDEEGSRLPILIVMALLVLAAFGGVVWLAYERGVASGRTEPRIITAEQGPVKVAPPAAASGSETPFKGLKIYEQPAPNDEEAGGTANTMSAHPAPSAAKPAMAAAPVTAPPIAAAPKPAHAKPAAPVQTATTSPLASTTAKPVAPATAKPAPPVDVPAASAANAPTAAAPADQGPVKPAAAAPTPAGAYLLQIGAYKSQAEADSSWKAFAAKHASLLAGFSPNVKQVDLGEKGTWYRLRVGSFADKGAANALCDRLKSDGGNCFLAK